MVLLRRSKLFVDSSLLSLVTDHSFVLLAGTFWSCGTAFGPRLTTAPSATNEHLALRASCSPNARPPPASPAPGSWQNHSHCCSVALYISLSVCVCVGSPSCDLLTSIIGFSPSCVDNDPSVCLNLFIVSSLSTPDGRTVELLIGAWRGAPALHAAMLAIHGR